MFFTVKIISIDNNHALTNFMNLQMIPFLGSESSHLTDLLRPGIGFTRLILALLD